MATIGQLTSPLADLTYYNNRSIGGVSSDEVNSDRAQAMLTALRKYDPNAQFVAEQLGGEGGSGATGYTLNFDAGKLPGASGEGTLGPQVGMTGVGTGATYMPRFSTVQPNMQLVDSNAVANSPIYGKVTSNRNVAQPASLLDTLGPIAVSALGMLAPMAFGAAGLGMGAGASSAIGSAQGGLAAAQGGMGGLNAGSALGRVLGNFAVNTARSVGSGNGFNPVSLAGVAGPPLGFPSWLTSGVTTLANLARSGGGISINPYNAASAALALLGGGRKG